MIGEKVVVLRPSDSSETDAFGASLPGTIREEVEDVLVQPRTSEDVESSNRPDGDLIKYTLHFPKTYLTSLRGALVIVRGETLRVVGDPGYFAPESCPTRWNRSVHVEVTNG